MRERERRIVANLSSFRFLRHSRSENESITVYRLSRIGAVVGCERARSRRGQSSERCCTPLVYSAVSDCDSGSQLGGMCVAPALLCRRQRYAMLLVLLLSLREELVRFVGVIEVARVMMGRGGRCLGRGLSLGFFFLFLVMGGI